MTDKHKHFVFSFLLTLFLFAVFVVFLPKDISVVFATTISFLTGLAKEIVWDLFLKKGVFEWLDLLFNTFGVFAGLIFLIIC